MKPKFLDLEGLMFYHKRLCQYIDEAIREHNKIIIMRECPVCGAHEFIVSDHMYKCKYCDSEFRYTTFYDQMKFNKIYDNNQSSFNDIDYEYMLENMT